MDYILRLKKVYRKKLFPGDTWDAWNTFLTPMYPALNTIRLPELGVFVVDSWDKHMMQTWGEIDDVLEERGFTHDQAVYSFIMRRDFRNDTEKVHVLGHNVSGKC